MNRQQAKKQSNEERGLRDEIAQPRFLVIGQIARPHGVRGELRADIHTDLPERFTWLKQVYLAKDTDELTPEIYGVETVRFHQSQVLIKLATVDDRDEAETLRRYWLLVPAEEAIPLAEGEYYLYQLLGLAVYTDEDVHLGELVEVIETGANHVFVVRGHDKEILLPDTDEVIQAIDFARGRMTVHLLPGL
ncbi:MAG: 16S rRNA processing protein RimM [Chloroflexi bacterium]|nr:16S rRNA processing protein RimM [Chloroflexota bacterium]MBP8055804.1 16S rRNA processing protein RimM [Chloroflexota bacterium]